MARRNPKTEFDIGSKLRTVRSDKQISQRELARKAGVTNGLISQIEQNSSSPSVSSLKRILDAIPMSLSDFFSDKADQDTIFFRKADLRELNPAGVLPHSPSPQKISLREVGSGPGRQLQMMHEIYAPGADTGAGPYTHNGEEAGIVIFGEIELTVGDRSQILTAGDAYLFDSTIPHRFRNPGDCDCIIVSACTPPSF